MQLTVLRDQVLAAIGDQVIVELIIRVDAVGRHIETEAVDVAQALFAKVLLHILEETVIGIPSLGISSILKPAFSTSGRQTWFGSAAVVSGTP